MANKYTDAAFAVIGLKPMEKLVLWVVCQRTDNANGTCFPSYARIADDAGIHRVTAIAAVKRLIALKLVSLVGHHGDANLYRVSLSNMQELSVATSSVVGVVANDYSGSSVPLPGELPTATTLVANGYSNSSFNSSDNSSSNEVKEGSEGKLSLACSLGNSGCGTALAVTPEQAPPNAAAPPSQENACCSPAESPERLTCLIVSLLGNSSHLLTPAMTAQMLSKANAALKGFTYDDLDPVLRWVLSPESDEPKWRWREIIAGATNPMAMFAKHVLTIVNKFAAYERKKRVVASPPRKSPTKEPRPQMPENLKTLWGNVKSFNINKEDSAR